LENDYYVNILLSQEKELVINGDENELIPLSEQEINNKVVYV